MTNSPKPIGEKEEWYLNEFYELYEEGRKNSKAPQSYIDFFKAREFLHKIAKEAKKEGLKEAREIVRQNTPHHITREYRETDQMRDQINKTLTNLINQDTKHEGNKNQNK